MTTPSQNPPSLKELFAQLLGGIGRFLSGLWSLIKSRRSPVTPPPLPGTEPPPPRSFEERAFKYVVWFLLGSLWTNYSTFSRLESERKFSTKQLDALREEVAGHRNAAYWNKVIPLVFTARPEPQPTETLESFLGRELQERMAMTQLAQQQMPKNIDKDFRKAIINWWDCERRFIRWCEAHRPLLLQGARGKDLAQVLAQPALSPEEVLAIPQQTNRELEDGRRAWEDVTLMLREVVEMRRILKERYPQHDFLAIP